MLLIWRRAGVCGRSSSKITTSLLLRSPTSFTKVVPGIDAFGGIDLNLSVGGMNPAAVEKMALTAGELGKFVWMATYDAYAQVRESREQRPYVANLTRWRTSPRDEGSDRDDC
jgi:hypothetical protein